MDIKEATYQYREIMETKLTQNERNEMLKELKGSMEKDFQIPVFKVVNWGMEHRDIYELYEKVRKSRVDY